MNLCKATIDWTSLLSFVHVETTNKLWAYQNGISAVVSELMGVSNVRFSDTEATFIL